MRQPFQQQILVPMAGILIFALTGLSAIDAWLAARQSRARILRQLGSVSNTIADSAFPLTDNVLRQMRGLSGAEFAVTSSEGIVQNASDSKLLALRLPTDVPPSSKLTLDRRLKIGERQLFHATLVLPRLSTPNEQPRLHVLYPVVLYERASFAAVWPRLSIGAISLVIVIVVSHRIAARMTRPLHRVRDHMEHLASGHFDPIEVPRRDDEIRDLSQAINQTAQMLRDYEQQVRREEQLRTLGRLGGAVAHQIRNAVTGCRVALELHQADCPLQDCESLSVAIRQLDLLEGSLRRFLAVKQRHRPPRTLVDLNQLVEGTVPLVIPQARHLGVQIDWNPCTEATWVTGDPEALREVLVNLLLNAIDAAAAPASANIGRAESSEPAVTLTIACKENERLQLCVADTGEGPSDVVAHRLFEPLVSTKPDGAGLGLSVAREILREHGGQLSWERQNGVTRFVVDLPSACPESIDVETVSR